MANSSTNYASNFTDKPVTSIGKRKKMMLGELTPELGVQTEMGPACTYK
jgi:hypothetical protein